MQNKKTAFFQQPSTGLIFWGILLIALLPWFILRTEQVTNSDVLWLSEVMRRILDGGKMTDVAYEPNPPLSMLVYILPVLAKSMLHVPLHYALYAQFVIVILTSALATWCILTRWNIPDINDARIITASYILMTTFGTSFAVGERDHMLAAFLVPFVLMQLTLTYDLPQARRWKWPVFVIGTLFILVKPHDGLLPSLLILHRLWRRKNLSVLKDGDFVSLAVGVLLYIPFVIAIFPDYATVIFPDVMHLYAPMGGLIRVWRISMLILMGGSLLAVATYLLPFPSPAKCLTWCLIAAAIIDVVPYAVQAKGLFYHLFPCYVFLGPAVCMVVFNTLKLHLKSDQAILATLAAAIVFTYTYMPLGTNYVYHRDYAHLPLSNLLKKECPHDRPCSFFMYNRDMGIIHETAYYTGHKYASRFPSFWFMPIIINAQDQLKKGLPANFTKAQMDSYFKRYAHMVAEDFATMKPDVVIISDDKTLLGGLDFPAYFGRDREFSKEWAKYKKTGTITLSYRDYYRVDDMKPFSYTVYHRAVAVK